MKFILPSKVPQVDFQFQLIASQDYWTNFKKDPLEIEYAGEYVNWKAAAHYGKWNDYCPVGSLEFCAEFGVKTLPRNIPPQLKKCAAGVITSSKSDLDKCEFWHVKSSDVIKHPNNGKWSSITRQCFPFEDGNFQAVEFLKEGFISEWRVFVLDGNIIDMQNYAGDIWTLPSKDAVESMIFVFEHTRGSNPPPVYTLDVGVHRDSVGLKTSVIEVHDFYACGTYNLNVHYHYPIMLWEWFKWYKKMAS